MIVSKVPDSLRSDIPGCAYVPSNKGPYPHGDVDSFSKALCGVDGYYFAARVQPDFNTPASEATPWPSLVPGSHPSDILVFRWHAEPSDGNIVSVETLRRLRPERIITKILEWLYIRVVHT